VRGRDLIAGLPKTVTLRSEEIREALDEPVGHIVDAVEETLDRAPPELAGDITDRGIILAGGGALLRGLEQRLREGCEMPCQLAESPLECVAVGSGLSLEEFETIHRAEERNSRASHSAQEWGARSALQEVPTPRHCQAGRSISAKGIGGDAVPRPRRHIDWGPSWVGRWRRQPRRRRTSRRGWVVSSGWLERDLKRSIGFH
ncbi:MAG TPA: rod shape-determining protein, partial [Solirubrobacterales bacterium]|nr:rod shape-determining protein [Solirubrobacterales bacterium]